MLSPSLLDPYLLPGSFEAAFRTFQANQAQIVQMKRNNDSFLSNAVAKYGPYFSNGQISPSMFPPVTGQQARPFGSMHNGYSHREQQGYQSPAIPRPPPYQSPLRHEAPANAIYDSFHSQTRGSLNNAPQSNSREFTSRDGQGNVRINDEEVAAAIRDAYRQKRENEGQPSQIVKDQEDDVTPKKKVSVSSISRIRMTVLTICIESNQSQRREGQAMVGRRGSSFKSTTHDHLSRGNGSRPEMVSE